jgi:taurine dioxygenase
LENNKIPEGNGMQDVIDIQVTPLSPACGAEISGVDLTRPLSAETVRAIRDAWNKHIVLVFRGQKLSQDDQLRFASYFGHLGERKRAKTQLAKKIEGTQQTHKNVMLVTNIKEDGVPIGAFGEGEFWFHIDGGYTERPYRYTFLYAIELPSTGGNTMFSNMYMAYDAVPAALKEKLKGRKRSTSMNITAPSRPAIPAISATCRITAIQFSFAIPRPAARRCSLTG